MIKTLVVMRHGKAEASAESLRDKDRRLTPAGEAALAARLPYMLRLFEAVDVDVRIWASPAKRAHQTAKLLEAALREKRVPLKGEIELHESLWRQDLVGFVEELRASEDEVVFAVGHVPFVEEAVEDLVGAAPSFSTGALACMELTLAEADEQDFVLDQDHGRLLWFVQGPVAGRWETLMCLQEIVTQVAEAIEDRRSAFFAEPTDIETIHRFRTNTRTLRSLLAFVKPWQRADENAEAQALLKEVVRHTSRLRELDVLEKHVRANRKSSPKLVEFCAQEARDERARVLDVLGSKRTRKAFERAMSLVKQLTWRQCHADEGLGRDVIRARFDALAASVGAELARVDLMDEEQTHDVRKRAKRVRYVAEYCPAVLGPDAVDIAKAMTSHQDTLGDVCDARANMRLMDEFLRRDLPKSVARELRAMRAQSEAQLEAALKAHATKQQDGGLVPAGRREQS